MRVEKYVQFRAVGDTVEGLLKYGRGRTKWIHVTSCKDNDAAVKEAVRLNTKLKAKLTKQQQDAADSLVKQHAAKSQELANT